MATEERRMKEQEDRRVRQQQMRVREEEEKKLREQEKQKQELELRRAQPAVTVKTEAQPQIEKDDDWFILFDVSPKETGTYTFYIFLNIHYCSNVWGR